MPLSLHTDSINASLDGGLGLAEVQEEVNENEVLINQRNLMMKRTLGEDDEEQKRYLQDLQIIDQETMILGAKDLKSEVSNRKRSSVLSV